MFSLIYRISRNALWTVIIVKMFSYYYICKKAKIVMELLNNLRKSNPKG